MLTTSFCSVISLTVWVFGTSSSMPDWRIGAVIMKMISSTRTTSMNGTMLISDKDDCVDDLDICGIDFYSRSGWGPRHDSDETQVNDFSIWAATSSAKVSSRCAKLRMLLKN